MTPPFSCLNLTTKITKNTKKNRITAFVFLVPWWLIKAPLHFFVFIGRFRSGTTVRQISQTVPSQPRAVQYSRP